MDLSDEQPQLVVIRGLPGSGKSTLGKTIARECGYLFFETDQFFESEQGYQYDGNQLDAARKWCLRSTRDAILTGQRAVVTGVFSKPRQLEPYLDMALSAVVIECTANYGSEHNVPDHILQKMQANWKAYPGAIRL